MDDDTLLLSMGDDAKCCSPLLMQGYGAQSAEGGAGARDLLREVGELLMGCYCCCGFTSVDS